MVKRLYRFPEVLYFQEGPGVRNHQYTLSGVKLLNVSNLRDGKIDLTTSNRYISEDEAFNKYSHFLCEPNDFIIASSGIKVDSFNNKMGFIHQSDLPVCMNTSTIRFKVLNKEVLEIRYFMYYLKSVAFKKVLTKVVTGSAQLNFGPSHLKNMSISLPNLDIQKEIVERLDRINKLLELKKKLLLLLDELIKSRFVEMFGDLIINSKRLNTKRLDELFLLKAGITTPPSDILSYMNSSHKYLCYGGNGVRGYVKYFSYSGIFPLIGRQGALCGNVQLAQGDFHATEHAILVKPLVEYIDVIWSYYALRALNLFRYHSGAAQPGISVKTLNNILLPIPILSEQKEFVLFSNQINKLKSDVQKSIDETQLLMDSLMQEYFG
ncbi:MAG: restriction endonuclease subunit S [Veillonella sp.]|uniref:restriction endonuclease subunit S n=1 Tax=Veillonella sp. TaxID=1926307 RepID=UPI002904A1D4|nr:restriction endonuclease subunit S [Veillonella sp.]MDU1938867.1 restriction endonuclease subunit S [Veillonella sp.]